MIRDMMNPLLIHMGGPVSGCFQIHISSPSAVPQNHGPGSHQTLSSTPVLNAEEFYKGYSAG